MSNLKVINKFKTQLSEFMSYLDLEDDDRTNKLYGCLDRVLVEIEETKEVLNGKFVLKLPKGFREKMEEIVIDNFVDGRDYSGYVRDVCEYEVQDMTDEELFEQYEEQNCDYELDNDEPNEMIVVVNNIINNEKLVEVINE